MQTAGVNWPGVSPAILLSSLRITPTGTCSEYSSRAQRRSRFRGSTLSAFCHSFGRSPPIPYAIMEENLEKHNHFPSLLGASAILKLIK
jgi:hypothetical protein